MLKKIFRVLFNRISIVAVLLLVQIGFFVMLMLRGARFSQYISWGLLIISAGVVLHIVNDNGTPEYKLAWCIPILTFPVFGGLLYLIIRYQSRKEVIKTSKSGKPPLPGLSQDKGTMEKFFAEKPSAARQAGYAISYAGYPAYDKSTVKYLPIGEEYFKELTSELEKAEKFIFIEYFIIASGHMWSAVLEILERKAADGVDVRVMYDSMGSLFLIPDNYYKDLEKKGIKCIEFNRFRPVMSAIQNNRDHRKICVIDGKVAFTGGINIGDEYINAVSLHGHWKDNGVMVEGDAVKSFTHMFLELWNVYAKADNRDYLDITYPKENDGYIMPYADVPGDNERVCESVYLNIISRANNYLYITTPYFIVGEEFITALELSAKAGVDVRLITPHIWDKKFVHVATRSYYKRLIKAGVRVFEYTPGFIHAKTVLCDGEIATVGTANLDYRSMYLQFECGLWMCGSKCISDIKDDILATMEKSHEITMEECNNVPLHTRFFQALLRPFTPLF
ncbi:MAG: cardiolipin synthase [Clostridia bacterium]|nr:cardiolipin synthase [Clostridia bacterium]